MHNIQKLRPDNHGFVLQCGPRNRIVEEQIREIEGVFVDSVAIWSFYQRLEFETCWEYEGPGVQ